MDLGEVVDGRFEILELAGSGGMGQVYRARDRLLGGLVALKVLLPSAAALGNRFAREAGLLSALSHPAIVRYVAHGEAIGRPFLAMEWLEGEVLSARLGRSALSLVESVEVAARAAEALAHAHASGVVHRDVKPGNLFLVDGEIARLKVIDFGVALAARLDGGGEGEGDESAGRAAPGTPGYMAPEQALGEADVDARADVFALGCVLFRCLAGRSPFEGEHLAAVLAKTLLEPAPSLCSLRSDVPAALDALVGQMLSKEPDERPADCAEALAALRGLRPVARPSSRAGPAASTAGRTPTSPAPASQPAPASASAPAPPSRTLPPSTLPPSAALTEREQRLVSLLLIGAEAPRASVLAEGIRARSAPFGARVERLADGSIVLVLSSDDGAAEQASRAARCALSLRELYGGAPVALVTGWGDLRGPLPVGEVIDRAALLLGSAASAELALDEVTAGLLGGRFDVGSRGGRLWLRGEHEAPPASRTLLGRATPFVGREADVAALDALFERCVAERAACAALLTAPAGFGKSRLRHEWVERLRGRFPRPLVLVARGDPMSAGSPFGLLSQAIREAASVIDGEPLAERRKKLLACVRLAVPAAEAGRVAAFLGELVGSPFELEAAPSPPASEPGDAPEADGGLDEQSALQLRAAREDPLLMGDQMLRAWEDFAVGACAARALVVVLEDLHWGDFPTVKYIDAALRRVPGVERRGAFFVLALGRPDVHDAFPGLWAERDLAVLRLGELPAEAGARLVSEVLGDGASAEEATSMAERSSGNALYLEELIRARAEGKGGELPGTVLALVQARISSLGSLERRVLRAASVFGRVFWEAGVGALVGARGAAQLGQVLSSLCRDEIIERRVGGKFPGQSELIFRHALVREAAYASLTEDDRALGHRLGALWLERAGERDAMVLAEHFERGKEPSRAVGFYRRAAEQALEGNDLEAVVARAERGIRCGAVGEVGGALRLLQADAHQWRGEGVQAEVCGLLALQMLPDGSNLWFTAAGTLASISARLGNRRLLLGTSDLLLRAPPGASPRSGARAIAMSQAALQLLFDGHREQAQALLAELPAEPSPDNPAVAAWVFRAHAMLATTAGDVEGGVLFTEAAIEQHLRAGDLRNACGQLANAGSSRNEVGCYEHAERLLREALQLADRLGVRPASATALLNLGLSLAMQGKLASALEAELAAIETLEAMGHRRLLTGARTYHAVILLLAGDAASSEREARAALETGAPLVVGSPATSTESLTALSALAAALLAQGRADEALSYATQAHAALSVLGSLDEGESQIRLGYAESLSACGRQREAREAIADARERLLSKAASISDLALRETFLRRARGNARTLALAEAWLTV
jgi:eukaryotic-like serine/threonine-protein kinase